MVGTEKNQPETSDNLSSGGGKTDDRKKKNVFVYVTGLASHAGRTVCAYSA
jgi:hypothetical protein